MRPFLTDKEQRHLRRWMMRNKAVPKDQGPMTVKKARELLDRALKEIRDCQRVSAYVAATLTGDTYDGEDEPTNEEAILKTAAQDIYEGIAPSELLLTKSLGLEPDPIGFAPGDIHIEPAETADQTSDAASSAP